MMAKAAADFMAGRDVTVLRCSPLERARQTAEPIEEQLNLPVEVDDRLIEPWNHFEGMRVAVGDGSWRAPRHWVYLRNPFRPSWGEPFVEVAARVLAAAQDAAKAAAGHEAVCVSHQLPIWTARQRDQPHLCRRQVHLRGLPRAIGFVRFAGRRRLACVAWRRSRPAVFASFDAETKAGAAPRNAVRQNGWRYYCL